MKGSTFLKTEHWILKLIYSIGLIAFLFHLHYFFEGAENGHRMTTIIAYSCMTIFYLRLAFYQIKNSKSKK